MLQWISNPYIGNPMEYNFEHPMDMEVTASPSSESPVITLSQPPIKTHITPLRSPLLDLRKCPQQADSMFFNSKVPPPPPPPPTQPPPPPPSPPSEPHHDDQHPSDAASGAATHVYDSSSSPSSTDDAKKRENKDSEAEENHSDDDEDEEGFIDMSYIQNLVSMPLYIAAHTEGEPHPQGRQSDVESNDDGALQHRKNHLQQHRKRPSSAIEATSAHPQATERLAPQSIFFTASQLLRRRHTQTTSCPSPAVCFRYLSTSIGTILKPNCVEPFYFIFNYKELRRTARMLSNQNLNSMLLFNLRFQINLTSKLIELIVLSNKIPTTNDKIQNLLKFKTPSLHIVIFVPVLATLSAFFKLMPSYYAIMSFHSVNKNNACFLAVNIVSNIVAKGTITKCNMAGIYAVCVSIEDAKLITAEHQAAYRNKTVQVEYVEAVKKVISSKGGIKPQLDSLSRFEEEVAKKKKKIGDILIKIDRSNYADVHTRRCNPDPIIKVRCTKPKTDNILTLHRTRKGSYLAYT
ncbi:hypothetical protein LXL04_004081 [Taraxacum kok-saghyz]